MRQEDRSPLFSLSLLRRLEACDWQSPPSTSLLNNVHSCPVKTTFSRLTLLVPATHVLQCTHLVNSRSRWHACGRRGREAGHSRSCRLEARVRGAFGAGVLVAGSCSVPTATSFAPLVSSASFLAASNSPTSSIFNSMRVGLRRFITITCAAAAGFAARDDDSSS